MAKKSRVTGVTQTRNYTGRNGNDYYVFRVTFENGEHGDFITTNPNQDAFQQGKEVSYERFDQGEFRGEREYKVKPAGYDNTKASYKGKGGYRRSAKPEQPRDASFALSYAKDMAVAHIKAGTQIKSFQVLEIADHFYKWLKEKEQQEKNQSTN